MKYQIYIKNTDSLFFDGEADDEFDAIESAKEAYVEKYQGETASVDDVEWSVVESEE